MAQSTPQLSILITAYREPETIGEALESITTQLNWTTAEILVICPDEETAIVARTFPNVRVLHDQGQGKPAALNQGLAEAAGEIIVMTDGDVRIVHDGIRLLCRAFDDPQVGAASGRPISLNTRDTMLGFWSHLLTDAGAHVERSIRQRAGEFFVCSGYLYAIRSGLIDHIPEDALAEDAVVSHQIGEQGHRIAYVSEALVYVRYPTTYADWLKQKVRSAGGYVQPYIADSPLQMRSFRHEATAGLRRALSYALSPREFVWSVLLLFARLHLWWLIFWRVRILRRPLLDLWQRVESTK